MDTLHLPCISSIQKAFPLRSLAQKKKYPKHEFYQQYSVTYRQNKLQHLDIRMNHRLNRQLDQALLNTMFCASK